MRVALGLLFTLILSGGNAIAVQPIPIHRLSSSYKANFERDVLTSLQSYNAFGRKQGIAALRAVQRSPASLTRLRTLSSQGYIFNYNAKTDLIHGVKADPKTPGPRSVTILGTSYKQPGTVIEEKERT